MGVMMHPAVIINVANSTPRSETRGTICSVITMFNLLANRLAPAATPSPIAGAVSSDPLVYFLVSSKASAYARRPSGINVITQASQQLSASSRTRWRIHHTTGCHQYRHPISRSNQANQ